MKKIFLILFNILSYCSVFCQPTTVTFKPGPEVGQDAVISTSYGAIVGNLTEPWEECRNLGDYERLYVDTWTTDGNITTARCLLKFVELSSIPQDAVIIGAELKIYGPHSGFGSSGDNNSVVQKITSTWNEQNVIWNTQPSTTTINQIYIPKSTSQFDWNLTDSSANLVAMIQNMVSNPANNFGFMIKLVTEETYRLLDFASSDNEDSALWPELTVTYEACSMETIVKDKFKVVKVKNPNMKKGSCQGC
jgi:hypothetical protein